ncbi:hypothetical protein Rsub_02293 [Raphidocelis subcapitata]|uniref:Uncharacterized protein n=1 Tax=Raphidocelis subcapitata TaxID=307507 RepID=A0A2V0NXM3_9CHLO|nr:hypothetical protein Rsub_02293 [Raphidocelis subcapitata]|eukprot:GBF89575.1 hypothetical protein Rsub_02293 [Raphidocelis subcapitata]
MSGGTPGRGLLVPSVPMELMGVPRETLQAFLVSYSRALLDELSLSSAAVPDSRLRAAVSAVAGRALAHAPPGAAAAAAGPPLGAAPGAQQAIDAQQQLAATQQQLAAVQQLQAAQQLQFQAAAVQQLQLAAAVQAQAQLVSGGSVAPFDVRLEWKHSCLNWGCLLDDCQLCRNNALKVCDDSSVFDVQYWVRDDGKGGQLVRAKCGADVYVQAIDRASNMPVFLPDVRIKLYVVNGSSASAPSLHEPVEALLSDDDGHLLFSVAGTGPEEDGGVPLDTTQDDRLGPVAHIPEFQFLNKNSKFRSGGRSYKAFRLLARASRRDPLTGADLVVAQAESEPFKVTTKKGYDGCRKAEYLNAREIITDKTFANLGETTINNLKTTFVGVDTVADLLGLVERAGADPRLEASLREVLNMSRDAVKWRNLTRILHERVVWDDATPRLWLLPGAPRPLGLVFPAHKGQADFGAPAGIVTTFPPVGAPAAAAPLSDDLQLYCGREIEQLTQLAAQSWRLPRHPGWRLAGDQLDWQPSSPEAVTGAYSEALGGGDPSTQMMQALLLSSPSLGAAHGLPSLQVGGLAPAAPAGVGGGAAGGGGGTAPMSVSGTTGAADAATASGGGVSHTAQSGEHSGSRGGTGRRGSGGGAVAARASSSGADLTSAKGGAHASLAAAQMGIAALGATGIGGAGRAASGGAAAAAAAAVAAAGVPPPMVVPVMQRPMLGAGGPGPVLAGLPVWEKAAVLQQAIREGWPHQQLQMVLASLTDEEIAAIRSVHQQQMASAAQRRGEPPGAAPGDAAAAAMDALIRDAGGGGGGGAAPLRPGGESIDADAIIEAAALEAVAAANDAGQLASARRALAEMRSGSRGARGGGGCAGDDDRAAFSIDDLRDLRGHLLGEGGLSAAIGSPPMLGALPSGLDRSFDSLSLPSIHDQDGWTDLLRDLRKVSSTSARSNPSFNATDWIPDSLGASEEDGNGGGDGGGDDGADAAPAGRAKRERSSAFAMRAHQQAMLQAMANNDSFSRDTLRTMVDKEHTASFGRHMPHLRVGSTTKDAATRAAGLAARIAPDATDTAAAAAAAVAAAGPGEAPAWRSRGRASLDQA